MKIFFLGLIFLSTFSYAQVGIGTLNPQGVFNIDGAKDNATTGVPTAAQQANDFVVTSAGNVGIGTTSPTVNLEVRSLASSTWVTLASLLAPNNTTSGNSTLLNFGVSASQGNSAQFRFVYSGSDAVTNRVDFGMNGYITPFISYNRLGNVGIGTTAPTQKLDVTGSGLFRNGNESTAFLKDQLLFGYNTSASYAHAIKTRHNGTGLAGNAIDFYTWKQGTDATTTVGTQHVMTLDGNGNVGVGTTAPTSKLHVNSDLAASNTINANASMLRLSRPSVVNVKWDNIAQFNLGSYAISAVNTNEAYTRMDLALTDGANSSTNNVMTWQGNGNVGIGTTAPVTSAILELNSTSKALLLTRVATTASITNPINGMLIYDISSNCLKAYENGAWSGCISTGGGGSSSANQTTVIPSTISLFQNRKHFIASIYDADYLPYSAPTAIASTSPTAADGIDETTIIDLQGSITTGGFTVKIPVTATGSGTLPAFEQIITIPASMTQDGNSRDLRLAWGTQPYNAATKTIDATIAAIGGELKFKKLDMNSGIGNNAQGILAGNFVFPFNAAGNTTNFEIRIIAGIPDRRFGQVTTQGPGAGTSGQYHNFIYIPVVAEDGKIWLNQNLGANYSNVNHAAFNPIKRALNIFDHNAKGSLFQWGRYSDGHELINRTDATTSKHKNTLVSTQSSTDITNFREVTRANWRTPYNQFLWQGVDGVNNPCPIGFRVPTLAEYAVFATAPLNIYNLERMLAGALNLTASGISGAGSPEYNETIGGVAGTYRVISQDGSQGGHVAWMHTSNSDGTNNSSYRWQFSGGDAAVASGGAGATGNSMAVRCIQD